MHPAPTVVHPLAGAARGRRAARPLLPDQLTCSPAQAADAAGVALSTVWTWISTGKLPSRVVNGRRLIPVAALRALIGADREEV